MNRRTFVQRLIATALGSRVAEVSRVCQAAPAPERLVLSTPLTHSDWILKDDRPGVSFGIDGVRHMLTVCKEAGISQVYWRVLDAGRALYRRKLVLPAEHFEYDQFYNPVTPEEKALLESYHMDYQRRYKSNQTIAEMLWKLDYSNFDSFGTAIQVGHELGLEIHAWVTINEDDHGWGGPSAFSRIHPEYCWRRRDGRPYRSQMSFAFPEVMEYKLAIIRELLQYDTDGLFLDWLRTGDVRDNPQTDADGVADHGYETPLVDGFQAAHKVSPYAIPNSDPRWVQFRAEPQTQFMRVVRKLSRQTGHRLPISVLVSNPWCYRGLGDKIAGNLKGLLIDVATWAKEGLVDAASAAGYFKGGGSTKEAYRALREETSGKIDVWPYEWVPKTPGQFTEQAERARSLGAGHILFWEGDYFDDPDAATRRAIASAMSANAAPANRQRKK